MIIPFMPFHRDKLFGRACNEAMALLPPGAWGVILDHDAMFTTSHWFAQIEEAIACRPDAGAFAVVTNRIASPWQRVPEAVLLADDILAHRKLGERRRAVRTLLDITGTKGFGGVVTVVNRDAWAECGGYYPDAMYCVDHSLFFRLRDRGRRVYLIEGLYVYHLRASSSKPGPQVPKWAECPCRGAEPTPRERVALP